VFRRHKEGRGILGGVVEEEAAAPSRAPDQPDDTAFGVLIVGSHRAIDVDQTAATELGLAQMRENVAVIVDDFADRKVRQIGAAGMDILDDDAVTRDRLDGELSVGLFVGFSVGAENLSLLGVIQKQSTARRKVEA
jgi:hypothetical protein